MERSDDSSDCEVHIRGQLIKNRLPKIFNRNMHHGPTELSHPGDFLDWHYYLYGATINSLKWCTTESYARYNNRFT